MEYVRERGVYNDLPLDNILVALKEAYGPLILTQRATSLDAFHA